MNRAIMWIMIAGALYIAGVAGFLLVFSPHEDDPRYLTASTITSFAQKRFDRAETIGDSSLLLGEFCGGLPPEQVNESNPCRVRFAKVDTDRDGQVTPKELTYFYLKLMRTADRNEDGRVTYEEWVAALQAN